MEDIFYEGLLYNSLSHWAISGFSNWSQKKIALLAGVPNHILSHVNTHMGTIFFMQFEIKLLM